MLPASRLAPVAIGSSVPHAAATAGLLLREAPLAVRQATVALRGMLKEGRGTILASRGRRQEVVVSLADTRATGGIT